MLEAVDFMHGEKRKEERKGAMAKRYKVDRTARLLSIGGFDQFLARRLSLFLQEKIASSSRRDSSSGRPPTPPSTQTL